MKTILLLVCFMLSIFSRGQDTIVVTSFSDYRIKSQLYKDSLDSYNKGKDVCNKIMILFDDISKKSGNLNIDWQGNIHDNKSYFLSGWDRELKNDQIVDSGSLSTFTTMNGPPTTEDIFIDLQHLYKQLYGCKVNPSGYVSAGEMPIIYIYNKPTPVIYKAPCFSKNDKSHVRVENGYSILDKVTRFILRDDGKTKIPYILRYYFHGNTLDSIQMIDPVDEKSILKYP